VVAEKRDLADVPAWLAGMPSAYARRELLAGGRAKSGGAQQLGNMAGAIRTTPRVCGSTIRPEVTNGPFLSHKGTERERRCAGFAGFRRERRLSLRTSVTGNRWFPTGYATTLQIAENWQPIVFLGITLRPFRL
jgi:hypothetical protein